MTLDIRFATGGEAELEEIIIEYNEKLRRYATSILFNHADAEDVLQDVFFTAFQKRHLFDGENLSAWLYKITYRLCLNKRKKKKFLFFSDVDDLVVMDDFTSKLANDDFMAYALSRLKISERALLYGRIVDNLSYEELSIVLGKSPTALRKQYERAKNKVAELLERKGQ